MQLARGGAQCRIVLADAVDRPTVQAARAASARRCPYGPPPRRTRSEPARAAELAAAADTRSTAATRLTSRADHHRRLRSGLVAPSHRNPTEPVARDRGARSRCRLAIRSHRE